MVTIEEFARITKKTIARDGFEGYLPTALYPDRRYVAVLEGIPADSDLASIAVEWAVKEAVDGEDFLVAFKVGQGKFKVVWRHSGGQEEQVFDAATVDI